MKTMLRCLFSIVASTYQYRDLSHYYCICNVALFCQTVHASCNLKQTILELHIWRDAYVQQRTPVEASRQSIPTSIHLDTHEKDAFGHLFSVNLPGVSASSGAVACRRTKTDLFVSDLAVRWPGVRHMLALDQAQAAGYVVSLTCALAMQPYKAQVLRPTSITLLVNPGFP